MILREKEEIIQVDTDKKPWSGGTYDTFRTNVFYISDLHLDNCRKRNLIEQEIEKATDELLSEEFINEYNGFNQSYLIFAGDIARKYEAVEMFFKTLQRKYRTLTLERRNARPLNILYVLGNHELSEFSTVEKAIEKYMTLSEYNIGLLENHATTLNQSNNTLEPEKFPFIVVGGMGYSALNPDFNADNILTAQDLTHDDEKKYRELFLQKYHKALDVAKEKNMPLICITHTPIKDWLKEEPSPQCVYFTGHTHKLECIEDERTLIYADNQVGYNSSHYSFKKAWFGKFYNPFIDYEDGIHEITTDRYYIFNKYNKEAIQGTKKIEQMLNSSKEAKFYMIKESGFYGFFISNCKRGTCICVGGSIHYISKTRNIQDIQRGFKKMVETYLSALQPYRTIQEEISAEVKKLGFSGIIHGCIIDISFFSHIMVNPYDGTITYYTSSIFGNVATYDSLQALLLNSFTEEELEAKNIYITKENDKYILSFPTDKDIILLNVDSHKKDEEYIGDMSIYKVSGKVNQLQRLFTTKVLREWNEELLENINIIEQQDNVDITVR